MVLADLSMTCALVINRLPSATTKPLPRKPNRGLFVSTKNPTGKTDGLKRSMSDGSASAAHTPLGVPSQAISGTSHHSGLKTLGAITSHTLKFQWRHCKDVRGASARNIWLVTGNSSSTSSRTSGGVGFAALLR